MRILLSRYRLFHLLALFALTIGTTSCTSFMADFKHAEPQQEIETTQAAADILFINGDFENALLEYEQIYETALSHEDRNSALYGLACTQMMLANSDLQLIYSDGMPIKGELLLQKTDIFLPSHCGNKAT